MSRLLPNLYLGVVAAFLVAPLVVLLGVSVNEPRRLMFPPEGFALHWYAALLTEREWLLPLQNSLVIAALASLLSVSVALPLAWFLWRYGVFYARVLFALGVSPFILPPVITALGFLVFWTSLGMYGHIGATVVSHGIFFVTLPLITISLGLESIEPAQIEAARTLGADERTVFRTVVVPLVLPYALSGLAFAFVLSLNEYIVAYMVAGFTVETLPIKIFNSLRYGYTPVMAAVAVVFVLLAALVVGLAARWADLPRLLGALRPGER
jgi:putative spermidine/putrescine transport system permease protein